MRFCSVTNYREHAGKAELSRGDLVTSYLKQTTVLSEREADEDQTATALKAEAINFGENIINEGHRYGGFNILLGVLSMGKLTESQKSGFQPFLYYSTNRTNTGIVEVPSGIHCLSNFSLNTRWSKAERGKELMASVLAMYERAEVKENDVEAFELAASLIDGVLSDKMKAEDMHPTETQHYDESFAHQ